MFGERKIKNRRFKPKEYEQELQESKIWKRRPRQYILDPPDYELHIIEPLVNFNVNFSLNYKF